MSAKFIETCVAEYLSSHLEFKAPAASNHSLVLALTLAIQPSIIAAAGGVPQFWWLLLAAVKEWYPNAEPTFEYKVFASHMVSLGGLSQGSDFAGEITEIWNDWQAWQREVRPAD
ncbi:hypothetical protein [Halioxenophilus sp. WMMB6]|uniref:hypothetical protein n=1 Tax=Halioxenophilus sp. WMMB6 TaxID=3073815 RepID=UPI00295EA4B1|nr:hypothetical protein [Halioxenophilus sp. WMMB6]